MSQTNNRAKNNNFNNKKSQGLKINKEITASEVRLIDMTDNALGVMTLKEAFDLVYQVIKNEKIEVDLVEISPNANPPVCKIMNYSKYLYEKNKKEKLNRKQNKIVKLKEIVIKPAIDIHDFNHKCKQAKSFLLEGDKVKVMLRMSGRELQHVEENMEKLKLFTENLKEISKIEQQVKRERNIVSTILAPLSKPNS